MGAAADRSALALPACLIIMDGFGMDEPGPGNAIAQAATPVLDELLAARPHTLLDASGEAVGLPEGQMGNSEVGHLNIGAGRVVFQELTRINRACADGSLAANPVLQEAFQAACAPGASYVEDLERELDALRAPGFEAAIASVSGRYYAMDRDNRWDRVQRAYDTLVQPAAVAGCAPVQAMEASYAEGVTDEFVAPVAFDQRGIRDGDAVVFFNFRPDRARQLTRAFTDPAFEGFARAALPQVRFVCLTEYDPSIPAPVAFPKEVPGNVLADVLADAGLRQYHIAETEKYAHVTFFLNGGIEAQKAGEERALIASPKVATYDLQPEMSEPEVADTLAAAIDAGEADVYIVNFANCDMVGHTGVIPAAVAAVEAVDAGVGKVLAAMERAGGATLVTADHGNADKMLADDGTPHTAHTTAPVPLVLVDATGRGRSLQGRRGRLADIAPTLLEMVGLPVPPEMTGMSLLA